MNLEKVSFEIVKEFTKKDRLYQTRPDLFSDFINFLPDHHGLQSAIKLRNKFPVDRHLLKNVFQSQYCHKPLSKAQQKNIESISDNNTYTIVTAHQPVLFGGPSYYITKIISVIRLAQILNEKKGDYHIIPVFINGAEDHDFKEINHCHLFNHKIEWHRKSQGPVGRLDLNGIEECLNNFYQLLGNNENADKIKSIMHQALLEATNYKEFVFNFLNALFASYGLLILDMDDARLKNAFMPIILKELFERPSEALIKETQEKLANKNFKPQAFAREINIFYMEDNFRERFTIEGETFKVVNTSMEFTKVEIEKLAEKYPEKFSPNVNLRPIYQEWILPNIAYIGGGGELAYWLERKSQFEYFGVFLPVLIRRNSLMFINKTHGKLLDKLSLQSDQLFENEDQIIANFLQSNTNIDIKLEDEIAQISKLLATITEKAEQADSTLKGFAEAEKNRILRQLENIEKRILRSLKKQEETKISQIRSLKSKLFPNQGLQERYDSFFQYYVQHDGDLVKDLTEYLNPLERDFLVFRFC